MPVSSLRSAYVSHNLLYHSAWVVACWTRLALEISCDFEELKHMDNFADLPPKEPLCRPGHAKLLDCYVESQYRIASLVQPIYQQAEEQAGE